MKKILIFLILLIPIIFSGCSNTEVEKVKNAIGSEDNAQEIVVDLKQKWITVNQGREIVHYSGHIINRIDYIDAYSEGQSIAANIKEVAFDKTYNEIVIFLKDKTSIILSFDRCVIYFNIEIND